MICANSQHKLWLSARMKDLIFYLSLLPFIMKTLYLIYILGSESWAGWKCFIKRGMSEITYMMSQTKGGFRIFIFLQCSESLVIWPLSEYSRDCGCPKKSKFLVQISTTPNLVYINVLGNQKKYQNFTSNIDRVPALLKIQRKFFKIQRENEVTRFSSVFLWK